MIIIGGYIRMSWLPYKTRRCEHSKHTGVERSDMYPLLSCASQHQHTKTLLKYHTYVQNTSISCNLLPFIKLFPFLQKLKNITAPLCQQFVIHNHPALPFSGCVGIFSFVCPVGIMPLSLSLSKNYHIYIYTCRHKIHTTRYATRIYKR